MKSTVFVDIHVPQSRVATLFADPKNNPKWMDDIERCAAVSGDQGLPGSVYRLIPKRGSMIFTATVLSRNLPNDLRLKLDSSKVTVYVHASLAPLPAGGTKLISEEVFVFKSLWKKVFGFVARPGIQRAHRRHMLAFKYFAEHHHRSSR